MAAFFSWKSNVALNEVGARGVMTAAQLSRRLSVSTILSEPPERSRGDPRQRMPPNREGELISMRGAVDRADTELQETPRLSDSSRLSSAPATPLRPCRAAPPGAPLKYACGMSTSCSAANLPVSIITAVHVASAALLAARVRSAAAAAPATRSATRRARLNAGSAAERSQA